MIKEISEKSVAYITVNNKRLIPKYKNYSYLAPKLIFHKISYGLLWLDAIWPKLSKIAPCPSYMYKITGPEKLNKTVSKKALLDIMIWWW